MAKEKNAAANPLLRELFQLGVYKRSQGRIARQVTFGALALVFALGAWRMHVYFGAGSIVWGALVPILVGVAGLWFSYRLVNLPSFADFLIAVEAEMNKVSWPSRHELFRSCVVVILLIFVLAAILYGYDLFWQMFLSLLGIVQTPSG